MRKLICGVIIGISYIIPGVCSISTAKNLNQYESLLECYSNFYNIKVLWRNIFLLIGLILGLLMGFIIIVLLSDNLWFLLTIFLSINIINLKISKCKGLNWIFLLLGIIFVLVLSLRYNVNNKENNYFNFIFAGIFVSLGFVLPGLSGSLLMLNMGVYDYLVNLIKIKYYYDINFLIFIITLFTFILIFSKIILKFISKKNNKLNSLVDGMVIGSVLIMVNAISNQIDTIYKAVTIILLFISVSMLIIALKTFNNHLKKKR